MRLVSTLRLNEKPLLVNDIGWNLRHPCGDCPFRRDAPAHKGVAQSIPDYLETIAAGKFAHTCHKTDNRLACDGPRNFKGEKAEHCAGALHFLLRAGVGLQLPLLQAAEAGKFDIELATRDAEANETVFASVDELLAYYLPVLKQAIVDRRNDPLVCVTFPENFGDPPTMLKLSTATAQGLDIVPCSKCGKPATSYDRYWPNFIDNNFCDEHGEGEAKSMAESLDELSALLEEVIAEKAVAHA